MAQKKGSLGLKDFSKEREENYSKKIDDYSPDEKVRILQDNLVFVNGLPPETSSRETLQRDIYFARYGPLAKLILNPPYPNKRNTPYQAYATYTNELDAALAIVALDGYKLGDRPLKVSFGTTKYCSHFLRGHECPNPDCFYLHRTERKREVSSGDTRVIFKQQNERATAIVCDRLEEVAQRILNSQIEDIEEGFPSLSELLDYLIDNQDLSQFQVDQAFSNLKNPTDSALELPKLEHRGHSMAEPRQKEWQKENPKLVKSNSHSTMCTPNKDSIVLEDPAPPQQPFREQEREETKWQGQLGEQNRQTVDKQKVKELRVQLKIEKLLIKEILKKGTECRSRFVKNAIASREECLRLRRIVEKYLFGRN